MVEYCVTPARSVGGGIERRVCDASSHDLKVTRWWPWGHDLDAKAVRRERRKPSVAPTPNRAGGCDAVFNQSERFVPTHPQLSGWVWWWVITLVCEPQMLWYVDPRYSGMWTVTMINHLSNSNLWWLITFLDGLVCDPRRSGMWPQTLWYVVRYSDKSPVKFNSGMWVIDALVCDPRRSSMWLQTLWYVDRYSDKSSVKFKFVMTQYSTNQSKLFVDVSLYFLLYYSIVTV